MTASKRPRQVPWGAEVALAFGAGATSFGLVAMTLAVVASDVVVVAVGVVCAAAVIAIERAWGIAYAVPAAMAALLAYDWFQFPPTHPHEFPDFANLANLVLYLGVTVLVGELAAYAGRRAEASEAARGRLAEEQAALRRVATLVAQGVPPDEVFASVAEEVGALLDVDGVHVVRYRGDELEELAGWSAPAHGPPSLRRVELDARSAVGAPIVVDGALWGAILAGSPHRPPLPQTAERRLSDFTELVATAISNTASREELARLADEQASLRRVATLVAHGVAPPDVFATVARELGLLLGVDATHMGRYEPDRTTTGVGSWSRAGDHMPVGTRVSLDGTSVSSLVHQTGSPARLDSYDAARGSIADRLRREMGIRSSVGAPIVVDGSLWGVMIASSKHEEPLPRDTESRIAAFTELVATAISNTEARAEVGRLADEQAALRRVATLVARGVPPNQLFDAVAEEVGMLLGVDVAGMIRYESEDSATAVATWAAAGKHVEIERPWPADGHDRASSVGAPIVVDGRRWGALFVRSAHAEPLPAETQSRIGAFTELVATAISNIQTRSDLAASRARIVASADEERRRVVRDLHDGAQQRLVHTIITLKLARQALQNEEKTAPALVREALDQAQQATQEVRELAHGILPSVLTHGGLRAGVDALALRMPVPVENGVSVGRLPAPVEAGAYFVVAEALTNVAKHARAQHAAVVARVEGDTLRVQVRDDGVGGARADGTGLVGLADRLAALDGRLRVESTTDGGTLVAAAIPLD